MNINGCGRAERIMGNRLKISKASLLQFMLSATLMIDYLNGMFQGLHLGVLFRGFLIVVCFSNLDDKRSLLQCLMVYLFLLLNLIGSFAVFREAAGLRNDISMALKVSLAFLITITLLRLHRKGVATGSYIERIIKANLAYGPGLFFFSMLMGRGGASYSWGGASLGFKSEFMSLNAVNAALIVLYIYTITKLLCEKDKLKWLALSAYVMIPMALLGTKTGIACVIVIPVMMFFVNLRSRRVWCTVGVILVILVLFSPVIIKVAGRKLGAIFDRQRNLFEKRDFMTFLFSTRNQRLARALKYYSETFSVMDVFPGRGYYEFHKHIIYTETAVSHNYIPIEMDWADILTAYGITGFLFTYIPSIAYICRARGHLSNRNVQICFWSAVILIAFGSLAGHVFTEAISSTFLAVVTAGTVAFSEEDAERKIHKGEIYGS